MSRAFAQPDGISGYSCTRRGQLVAAEICDVVMGEVQDLTD